MNTEIAAAARAAYLGEDGVPWAELKPEIRERWERVVRTVKQDAHYDDAATAEYVQELRAELADWKAGRYIAVVQGPENGGVSHGVMVPPIRVPLSDEVIEKMAEAACDGLGLTSKGIWGISSFNQKQAWKQCIRAALAAGGLEPCAVPEYAPEDVAFPISSTIERNMQLEKECEHLTDRLSRVSAKSARRAKALKECQRGMARLRKPHDELYRVAYDRFSKTLDDNARLRAELSERRAEQAPMGEEIVRLRQQLYNMNAIRKLLTHGDDIRTEEIRGVEDVPLYVPERASDEELANTLHKIITHDSLWKWDSLNTDCKETLSNAANAVRARVESPLLAEIETLKAKVDAFESAQYIRQARAERDTLKARVAELEAEVRANIEWQEAMVLDLKNKDAELEAIKEIPEVAELITRRPDESLSTAVMRLRNERNDLCNKLASRDERITSLVSELEAVTAERDELRGVRERLMLIVEQQAQELQDDPQFRACRKELSELKIELAALHQPVDADAWKTELRIDCPLGGEQTLFVGDSICATVNVYAHGRHENSGLSPADAARAAQWLASYAAAHGCPVGLPPILSGLPEAMQATEPRKWTQSFAENLPAQLIAEEHNRAIDALSENAVIDVPKGVPSLEELRSVYRAGWDRGAGGDTCMSGIIAIRDAVLAGVGQCMDSETENNLNNLLSRIHGDGGQYTQEHGLSRACVDAERIICEQADKTHEPTDTEVEALAKAMHAKTRWLGWSEMVDEGRESWRDTARAAFAHIGRGECQECAKWKSYGTKMEDNARVLAKRIDKTRMSIDAARAALEGE